jgi:hypothetical protein
MVQVDEAGFTGESLGDQVAVLGRVRRLANQ